MNVRGWKLAGIFFKGDVNFVTVYGTQYNKRPVFIF